MKQKISETLSCIFLNATLAAFPQLCKNTSLSVEIAPATQEQFGHYQFNSAMKLAKILGASPREIAYAIAGQINAEDVIARLEVAGPGFINMTLKADYLSQLVDRQLKHPHFNIPELSFSEKKRIIIDFSSPNTAKEMHVGHLRSTIIGDSLARTFEFLGYDVLRLNHIGDWGTSFGMLIAYMKENVPNILQGHEQTDLSHLMAFYRLSKAQFDNDPSFKKRSQLEVVELQSGNPESLKAWKMICDISRKAYQEIYDLLDIRITERGESFYNPFLPNVVAELEAKGLVSLSDGAKCIFIDGFVNREGEPLPLMIQKTDGGYNYDTTDMAAIRQRILEEKGDRLIYVTDAGQSIHFQQIFKAAEMAGYLNPSKVRADHVPFGLVLGLDGKKFRTRSGDTEPLINLLNAAIEHADKILLERSPELPLEERRELARTLGIGAIKYADLCCHRTSDYTFSYDRMLRFEGNTAAYLMYSYVRVEGIKRKVGIEISTLLSNHSILLKHPSEIALGLQLAQFYDTLEQVVQDLLPNRLTEYLYTLAEKFNAFFRDCRVEGAPEQNSRLLLCECTALTLKQGLNLLGVHTVEKM